MSIALYAAIPCQVAEDSDFPEVCRSQYQLSSGWEASHPVFQPQVQGTILREPGIRDLGEDITVIAGPAIDQTTVWGVCKIWFGETFG